MARPLRIEFEGAWYHVMNRGAAGRAVFRSDEQRQLFLDLLADLHDRFGVETHAYCLLDNHYHLLLRTPNANLSRAMRHLDGVYTQRHNRAEGRDGPLFRGRFRSIVVDADSYLLSVSRYIHRNPIEAGLTDDPAGYPWSSYPAYVGRARAPAWLHRRAVMSALGGRATAGRYRAFVESKADPDVDAFYAADRGASILGDEAFHERVRQQCANDAGEVPALRRPAHTPSHGVIIDAVAAATGVDPADIRASSPRGRAVPALSEARMLAMYLCQTLGQMKLTAIRDAFGLGHYGSVAGNIARYRERRDRDARLRGIEARLQQEIMKKEPALL
ncbi:MAG: transposase [Rhodosalinus sp.]